MEFEWDPSKAAENLRKHKVSFNVAATMFGDLLGSTASDPDHAEQRERVRIVSARKLTRREKRAYEETPR